jgi:hypothetical protein
MKIPLNITVSDEIQVHITKSWDRLGTYLQAVERLRKSGTTDFCGIDISCLSGKYEEQLVFAQLLGSLIDEGKERGVSTEEMEMLQQTLNVYEEGYWPNFDQLEETFAASQGYDPNGADDDE